MNIESIKNNIDRKIERFINDDNLSIEQIISKLETTRDNFKKIHTADTNSSARNHMISMYTGFSDKRIKDLDWASKDLTQSEFFAGIGDLDLFKLIKLRDKISQEVLEEAEA